MKDDGRATGRVWAGVPGNWGKACNALSMCPVCFVNPRSMREQDMAHVCAVCVGATGAGEGVGETSTHL